MGENTISVLGSRYHNWIREHPHAEEDFAEFIEDLLNDAGVTFDRVSVRVKAWNSLKAKAKKKRPNGQLMYPDPWNDIHDLIGARVNVFHSTEIPVALKALSESFIVHRSTDKTAETRISGDFGYGSHHLVLEVPPHMEELSEYVGHQFEVQVRTVLQHAWAEFEHDIRYKQGTEPLDPRVDRAFTLAAGLIELADQQFDQIAALRQPQDSTGPDSREIPLSAETLPGILAMLLGNRFPRSRSEHYRWLEEILTNNGITTVTSLEDLLNDENINAVSSYLNYRFIPGQVRLIDDLLLLKFGTEHIERTGDTGTRANQRPARLQARLKTMRKAAKEKRQHL